MFVILLYRIYGIASKHSFLYAQDVAVLSEIRYDGNKVTKKEARTVLQQIILENFCQHEQLQWQSLQNINLIIGENSSGKTILLKAIYSALRVLEQFGKGNDKRELADILAEKLYWTFQVEALGDLVEKGKSALNFSMIETHIEEQAKHCFKESEHVHMNVFWLHFAVGIQGLAHCPWLLRYRAMR